MKYSYIQKYTSKGHYQIDASLHYLEEWVTDGVENLNLQLNPDFQRGHVWTEEQQIAYVEHLLRGGESARVVYFNHPGWMTNWKGDFVCVDGLQRITACLKFLRNEIKVFGKYYEKDFEDRIPFNIGLKINVNNLQTRKEVLKWYLEMNSGGTIHTDKELDKVRKLLEKEQDI